MKKYKSFVVLLVLLAVSTLSLEFLSNQVTAVDWWNMSWSYRKPATVSENSGSTLSNYQVNLIVNYVPSKMKLDFSDLRFTASDQITPIPYWIESYTASVSAVVWVKVPTIPASGTTTIYLYYGNPSATSISNGTATFEFFDDFQGTTLNPNKWTVNAVNSITNTINNYFRFEDATKNSNSYWVYDGTDTGSQSQAKWTPASQFVVEYKTKISDLTSAEMGEGMIGLVASDNTAICGVGHGDWWGNQVTPWRQVTTENQASTLGTGVTKNSYFPNTAYKIVSNTDETKWKIINDGQNLKFYDNEGLFSQASRSSTVSKLALIAGAYGTYAFVDYIQLNDLRVRKYVSVEPSFVFGVEESYGSPSPLSINISPLSAQLQICQTQTFSSTVSGGSSPYEVSWINEANGSVLGTGINVDLSFSSVSVYLIHARATDNVGATADSQTATINVTVPVLTVSISPLSVYLQVNQSQVFTSSISGELPPCSVRWIDNVSKVVLGTDPTLMFNATVVGNYQIYAEATDSVETVANSSISIVIVTDQLLSELKYGVFFNVRDQYNNQSKTILQDLADAGQMWVRIDWQNTVQFVSFKNDMNQMDLRSMALLETEMFDGETFTLADWQGNVSAAVNLAPDIPAWEIWNEPELSMFQLGYQDGSPQHYMDMLIAARNIIKSVNPNALIVGPAVSGFSAGFTFLQQIIDLGALNYLDVVSVHAYQQFGDNPITAVNTVRSMINDAKPVWITETGYYTYQSSTESQQNTVLLQNFNPITGIQADVMFWYELIDEVGDSPEIENHFGVVKSDYTHKLAYDSFKSFVASGVPQTFYTLTVQVNNSTMGSVAPSIGQHSYLSGTIVNVTAYPSIDHKLSYWLLNGTQVGSSSSINVTMNSSYIIQAVFSYVAPNGTIAVSTLATISGQIFINSVLKGEESWTGQLAAGNYTISLGDIAGYETPSSRQIELMSNQTLVIIVVYVKET